jgi:Tfp pilus assembly protein PilO
MEYQMTHQSTNKYSLVALILFLIALAGAIFFVKPLWDDISSLSLGRDDLFSQRSDLYTKVSDLQKIQQTLSTGSEVARETTLASIPEKLEQDKLILDLQRIASENDVILNGVSFSVPTTAVKAQISKVSINANMTANESSLIDFLRAVESNTRKILVKTITVQIGKTEEGIKRINFNVSMEAYFQGSI